MIFLVVFGLIAIIVIALNMKDSANLEKIETYLKAQDCKNIIYSKGAYKGVCKDSVIQVGNSFSVDIEKNKTIFKFDKIKNLDEKEFVIIINNSYNIEFKDEKNKKSFYKSLKEKLNK